MTFTEFVDKYYAKSENDYNDRYFLKDEYKFSKDSPNEENKRLIEQQLNEALEQDNIFLSSISKQNTVFSTIVNDLKPNNLNKKLIDDFASLSNEQQKEVVNRGWYTVKILQSLALQNEKDSVRIYETIAKHIEEGLDEEIIFNLVKHLEANPQNGKKLLEISKDLAAKIRQLDYDPAEQLYTAIDSLLQKNPELSEDVLNMLGSISYIDFYDRLRYTEVKEQRKI